MTMIKKVFLYMLLFSLGNCGYEPMYSKNDTFSDEIGSVEVQGSKIINRRIISSLNLKNKNKKIGYKLIINSDKKLETVLKDSASNDSVYKSTVTVKVVLMDKDQIFKERTFSANFTYNNIESKFKLSQYQKNIEINLINEISKKIFIYLRT